MQVDEVIQQPGQRERSLKEDIFQGLHVALPGQVVAYNEASRTVNVQPSVRLGAKEPMPLLLDVPVFFPGYFSFDISAGDECLVIFADRCIDAWFQHGGQSVAVSARRHDLSDGFALIGFSPKQNQKPLISLSELERRVAALEGG